MAAQSNPGGHTENDLTERHSKQRTTQPTQSSLSLQGTRRGYRERIFLCLVASLVANVLIGVWLFFSIEEWSMMRGGGGATDGSILSTGFDGKAAVPFIVWNDARAKGRASSLGVRASAKTAPKAPPRGVASSQTDEEDRLLRILRRAGANVTPELERSLPPWSSIADLYGNRPIVKGLDSCSSYRAAVPLRRRIVAPAGMYHTGTNLLKELLKLNCYLPRGQTVETDHARPREEEEETWPLPWGKHVPATFRLRHSAPDVPRNVNRTDALPIVLIKNPYSWMVGMCRFRYGASWKDGSHCPNLVDDEHGRDAKAEAKGTKVVVQYAGVKTKHESLAHLWNDWYESYMDVTFPRLVVRFEDLLYRPREVLDAVCDCAGGRTLHGPNDDFRYLVEPAKVGHNTSTGLASAMTEYGRDDRWYDGFERADLEYVRRVLREDLMEAFGYRWPPSAS